MGNRLLVMYYFLVFLYFLIFGGDKEIIGYEAI
jgi:hypothetical protein